MSVVRRTTTLTRGVLEDCLLTCSASPSCCVYAFMQFNKQDWRLDAIFVKAVEVNLKRLERLASHVAEAYCTCL